MISVQKSCSSLQLRSLRLELFILRDSAVNLCFQISKEMGTNMSEKMNLILAGEGAFFLWETKGEYLFEALVMPVSGCYSSVTIKLTEEQKVKILADESYAMILFGDINGNTAKYQKEQGVSILNYI